MKNLDKRFFATHAVNDVSFHVDQGQIVALLGENGAGKSTIIKMLAGVYKADSGEILVSGAPSTDAQARKQIAIVHQNLGLIEWMTVADNIALSIGYPRRAGLISTKLMNEQAERVLAAVGGGIDPEARVFDLPRTERSLLAIARGLIAKPKLLILDEPTASLPEADVERLLDMLRELRNAGVGMIYVSHRLDEIYRIATRAVIIRNGRVVGDRKVSDLSSDELIELIVGRGTENPVFTPPGDETRLSIRELRMPAAGPINADIKRGEIIALCGLRGAGQDAIGRAIAGAMRITGGELRLDGERFVPKNVPAAVEAGIGFATSNRETEATAPGLSVRENLFLNPSVWGRKFWQFATGRAERQDAAKYVRDFGVRPADPELSLDTLSGGNQQKVILARWFGVGRKVVVIEEPTMGVDVGAKADIYRLLSVAAAEGTSIVVVSTDMEEVAKIAHRALVFGQGRVVAEITGGDVTIGNLLAAASELTLSSHPQTIPSAHEGVGA